VRDEVVARRSDTATRMDKFTEMMLAQTGLIGMIGKAERGPSGIAAIRTSKRLSDGRRRRGLPGVQAIHQARVVGFADLAWRRSTNST